MWPYVSLQLGIKGPYCSSSWSWRIKTIQYANIYARTVHVQKVHEGGTKQICKSSKDCLRPKALRQHIRNIHENRNDYKCPQCFKDFSTKSNMNNHLKTVQRNTWINFFMWNCWEFMEGENSILIHDFWFRYNKHSRLPMMYVYKNT